jgi:hypothetical protein
VTVDDLKEGRLIEPPRVVSLGHTRR